MTKHILSRKMTTSGRKPLLKDYTTSQILQLSRQVIYRWLSNPEVSDSKKIPVAMQFFLRTIPATAVSEGRIVQVGKVQIEYVSKNGQESRQNVGMPEGVAIESPYPVKKISVGIDKFKVK